MVKKKIVIPSMAPGGLEAECSQHFGHCEIFTVVELEDGKVLDVNVIDNIEHVQGGCMEPVMYLKEQGADALLVSGIGLRPLMGFQQVGIEVLGMAIGSVGNALQDYINGGLTPMDERQVCGQSRW